MIACDLILPVVRKIWFWYQNHSTSKFNPNKFFNIGFYGAIGRNFAWPPWTISRRRDHIQIRKILPDCSANQLSSHFERSEKIMSSSRDPIDNQYTTPHLYCASEKCFQMPYNKKIRKTVNKIYYKEGPKRYIYLYFELIEFLKFWEFGYPLFNVFFF